MKRILNFSGFRENRVQHLNENVDAGKKLLKELFLVSKVAKQKNLINKELEDKLKDGKQYLYFNNFSGENLDLIKKEIRSAKLDEREVKELEKNPDFLAIKEMLSKNAGYVYNFAYFHFVEDIPLNELKQTYDQLIEYKDLLNTMDKKFDHTFIDTSVPNNYEILTDQLIKLSSIKKIKKYLSKMPKPIREDYKKTTSKRDIEEFGNIIVRVVDVIESGSPAEMKIITQLEEKISRYTTVKEVIAEGKHKLKALDNIDMVKFYKKIEQVNNKFGKFGADIIFDENGILILDVKSYLANVVLNKHTSHCIVSSESHWNSYVETPNNKQYYIYNFNPADSEFDGQSDDRSVIGITICTPDSSGKKIYKSGYGRACHTKSDKQFSSEIVSLLKEWEKKYDIETDIFNDILVPMSEEELKLRESKKEADRNIILPGLSIEQIAEYVKLGADINKKEGAALTNAIKEDDREKVDFLIDLGANVTFPNLTSNVVSFFMAKKLIEYGAFAHGSLLTKDFALSDINNFIYLINAGADVNYNNGEVIRQAIAGVITSSDGKKYEIPFSILKLLVDNIDTNNFDFKKRVLPIIFDYGAYDALKLFIEKGIGKIEDLDIDMLVGDDSIIDDMAFKSRETPEQVKAGFEKVLKELGAIK